MPDRFPFRSPVLGADPCVGKGDGDTTHERNPNGFTLAGLEESEAGDAGAEVAGGDEGDEG